MPLTKRQRQILDYLTNYGSINGYAPSFEEIAEQFNYNSLATVHEHLSNLERKGYIKRSYNESRAIEILTSDVTPQAVELELLGAVAAGVPIEEMTIGETVAVPQDFVRRAGRHYVLKVRGNSMIDDHICEGDMILVENTVEARDGDIVVALVNGTETTLKRFYREGNTVRLQPANSTMSPIRIPAQDVRIQGRLLAVLRKY